MEQITYFTGAGASFNSMPLVKNMNERMIAFKVFLQSIKDSTNEYLPHFIEELNELIDNDKKSTSIDAYAKQLYISSGSEIKLLRLKAVLSSYFIFEQLRKNGEVFYSEHYEDNPLGRSRVPFSQEIQDAIRTNIDKRYNTFWAEYLEDSRSTFPDNIKIISWNYDLQFETSYSAIKGININIVQKDLKIFPAPTDFFEIENPTIVKLNGTAGMLRGDKHNDYINYFDLKDSSLKDNVNDLIHILRFNYDRARNEPLIHFAWEENEIARKARSHASEIMTDTSILVIIGYSFPTFNRTVDREIFKSIPNLKKIYIQVSDGDLEEILDRLDGINPDLRKIVKPITKLDTFHIPREH